MNPSDGEILSSYDDFVMQVGHQFAIFEATKKINSDLVAELKSANQRMAMLTKTLQSQTESLQQVEGQLKAYRAHEVEELMNLGLSIQLEADSMRLKNEIEVLKSKKRVVERELHIERADKERVIRSNQALVRDLNVEAAKVAATKKRLQDVEIDLEGLKKQAQQHGKRQRE